jgi:hypothetical protein
MIYLSIGLTALALAAMALIAAHRSINKAEKSAIAEMEAYGGE